MESKNIFEKSSSRKISYYIAAGLCIAVIGVLSYLSYTSAKSSAEQKKAPLPETTDKVDVPKDDVPKTEKPQSTITDTLPDSDSQKPSTQTPVLDTPTDTTPDVKVESKPYIMPLDGEITVTFSLTNPIYSKTLGDWRIHDGIDISAKLGTNVVAVNDGVVEDIKNDDLFGITVVIKHTDGKKSIYSNLEDSVELEKGQIIKRGEIVGKVGESAVYEISDGAHLHFEMSDNGKKIDPAKILTKQS